MSFKNVFVALVGFSLALSGCTGRSGKPVQVDQNNNGQKVGGVNPVAPGTGDGTEVPVNLNKKELEQYNINTANLRYKFTYLTAVQEDAITFDATGNAKLTFKNLPAEQSGTLTLEISENAVAKLRGSVANVVLKRGQANNISLKLTAVDPNNGGNGNNGNGSTDLVIDVSLDNGNNPPPPGPTPQPPTPQPPTPQPPTPQPPTPQPPTPQPPTPGPGPQPVDPVQNWDGKSFQGNAKWTITPVN